MNFLKTALITCLILFIQIYSTYAQQRSESDDLSYALKLYNEKFYDLAAQQFSRFVNNFPGSNKVAEAGYYSGMALYYLDEFENARIEFQRVAVDFPRHDRAAESWYMIGECYESLSNAEEAAKAFEMVKLLHPNHDKAAESILRAGNIYQDLNRYEIAEQLYGLIQNRYIESVSYFPSILAQGKLYLKKGQISKAKDKFETVISSKSDKNLIAQAWYYLGESFTAQGNHQQAISPFQTVINSLKDTRIYPKAALTLSRLYLQQAQYSQAQKVINDALNNKPPGIYLYKMQEQLGDAYYLNRTYALAGNSYITSLESSDSTRFIIRKLKLALSWYKQNNTEKAIENLREVILDNKYQKNNGFEQAKRLYFQWMLESGNYEQGIADIYALKSSNVSSDDDQNWLVIFLKNMADWQSLIRELQPAIYSESKFKQKDNFVFELANAHEQLERYEESARFYRMLLESYSSSELVPLANDRLANIQDYYLVEENIGVGQMALLIGDLINRKDDASLQFKLGKIYYENLKDYNNALAQFRTSLQAVDDLSLQVDIYHYIGLTYQKLAEQKTISSNKKQEYLNLAKENLGWAMENLTASSEPDLVAWHFVSQGIKADNSSVDKQIGYYKTLVQQYPNSPLCEYWLAELGKLTSESKDKSDAAINYYNKLVEQFQNSNKFPDYLYERALISLKSDREGSINDFKRIAGSYPHSYRAASALYNLGIIWESDGNYSSANQIYSKILTDYYYTDLAENAKFKMGDTYLSSGKSSEAVAVYKQILYPIEVNDVVLNREFTSEDQATLTFKLGYAYFDHGDRIRARRHLIDYLANNPNSIYSSKANFLLGEIYVANNDPAGAISSYKNVSENDEFYFPKAKTNIANLYFEIEDYANAADSYRELESLVTDPNEKSDILAFQIISLIRSGKKSTADKLISGYRKSYKSEINHLASFQFEFGNYYRKSKNYNQSVKFFQNVQKSYSKSSYVDDAEYYLALTYIAVNRHQDAINILTSFAKKYPDSNNLGAVLNTLGGIYFRSEKYESAITSFKSAMDKPLQPNVRQQVMSNLIKAYTFVNFWDAALALSREYIDTYPYAEDVIDKKILIGRAYVSLNQVDRAVELLKETRLIADSEREPEIQFYIGDAYFQTGQYENAIAEYVKIPLLSRKTKLQWEASALYYSGQAYEKLGRIGDAKRMYSEIVKRPGIDLILKKEAQKRIEEIE